MPYHHEYAKACTTDLHEDVGQPPDYLDVPSEHRS